MNESILLEALEKISMWRGYISDNSPLKRVVAIATEAIKKWQDSSGKETGMKWVKASERPKEDGWKIIKHNDDGTGGSRFFHKQTNRWFFDSGCYDVVDIEDFSWLDESVPPYKEEETEIKNYEIQKKTSSN